MNKQLVSLIFTILYYLSIIGWHIAIIWGLFRLFKGGNKR